MDGVEAGEMESFHLDLELQLKEDIAAELEHFILLTKLGVFDEALQMVTNVLWHHLHFFPVFAETCTYLVEVNAMREARRISEALDNGTIALRTDNKDEILFVDLLRLFAKDRLAAASLRILSNHNELQLNLSDLQGRLGALLYNPDYDSPVQLQAIEMCVHSVCWQSTIPNNVSSSLQEFCILHFQELTRLGKYQEATVIFVSLCQITWLSIISIPYDGHSLAPAFSNNINNLRLWLSNLMSTMAEKEVNPGLNQYSVDPDDSIKISLCTFAAQLAFHQRLLKEESDSHTLNLQALQNDLVVHLSDLFHNLTNSYPRGKFSNSLDEAAEALSLREIVSEAPFPSKADIVNITLIATDLVLTAVEICCNPLNVGTSADERFNNLLQEAYSKLFASLFLFDRQLNTSLQYLLPTQAMIESLPKPLSQRNNALDDTTVEAMKARLGTAFDKFMVVIGQVCELLKSLLDDEDIEQNCIIKDKKKFVASMKHCIQASRAKIPFVILLKQSGSSDTKAEELGFIAKEIQYQTDALRSLTSQQQYFQVTSVTGTQFRDKVQRPSNMIPDLSKSLYIALCERLGCSSCQHSPHSVRIGLQFDEGLHKNLDPTSITYVLLNRSSQNSYQTMFINVKSRQIQSVTKAQTEKGLQNNIEYFCTFFNMRNAQDPLFFTAESFGKRGQWSIYPERTSIVPKSAFGKPSTEVTLSEALSDLSLIRKRHLALTLAYGCMIVGGTPWLAHRWTKENVLLSRADLGNDSRKDTVMLSSQLERQPNHSKDPALSPEACHALPSILSLGIVLLELETGQAIEDLRDPETLTNDEVDENTDFFTAIRVIEANTTCTPLYREAVLACLDWQKLVEHGVPASLHEERVRARIYNQIIKNLEAEVDALSCPSVARDYEQIDPQLRGGARRTIASNYSYKFSSPATMSMLDNPLLQKRH